MISTLAMRGMRLVVVAGSIALLGVFLSSTAHADDAQYVSDLAKRGFIQPMQLSSPYAYVPIGPNFQYLGSPDAESQVCTSALNVATATDSTITTAVFQDGSGNTVGQCTAAGYQRSQ